jgi:hypothetical protein
MRPEFQLQVRGYDACCFLLRPPNRSIDQHSMTIIEVDGVNHQQLTVDSIQIFGIFGRRTIIS